MNLTKRIWFSVLLLGCAAPACAQLVFAPAEWDFGSIEESGGRVSHTFTGVNRGRVPVVVADVVATCGCTVPEFSRRPVLPGDSTRVIVTYDPMNRPGAFSRSLGVYSSERKKIASLTVSGSVVARQKSIEELFPFEAGAGLRFDGTLCAFTYIYQGRSKQMTIGYANTSDRPLRLELRPRTSSGLLSVDYPRSVAPGGQGQIDFRYEIPADAPRYGTVRDAFEVWVDGRRSELTLVAHGIGTDDPAAMTSAKAPQAKTSDQIVKFGSVKHSGPVVRKYFTLSNEGRGVLIVRAVEHSGRIGVGVAPGCRIAPGGTFRVELALDPSAQEYGLLTDHLILVTNDPVRPMRRVRMTAIIED
ncbi:MAG: DUF1573 domain-containing protein [Alistipes sp.]|nr:DUF1573 domain-containing protein [Alistipes sp.]